MLNVHVPGLIKCQIRKFKLKHVRYEPLKTVGKSKIASIDASSCL